MLAIPVGKPRLFLADKGYDGDFLREELLIHGIRPVIPPKANRKNPPACDFRVYKDRNRIERMFNRLKQFRRVATRYDKTRKSFSAFLALAAAKIWLPYFVNRTYITAFEESHKVKFVPTFFDGNSEAYNKLRVGGSKEFDLVQADGFWPQLYFRENLLREVDYSKVPNSANYLPEFSQNNFKLLSHPESGKRIGFPFCWGAYGITYDAGKVAPEKTETLECMFNPEYSGMLSTSARFEENIALAALLVTNRMDSRDKPRPDGKPFNPYVLTDEELAEVEKLLIQQKSLLLTRYQDFPTLFQLFQSGAVVAATEFAQVFRQLLTAEAEGAAPVDFRHALKMKEGGLGWVDTWLITSGVQDGVKFDLCSSFIDLMISPEVIKKVGEASGCSTTIDLRSISTDNERKLFLMDRSSEIGDLFMFDQPSSPEKWERVWSNVQAA